MTGIQGIYATCDRGNPRWVWVSRRARSWHSGDSQYCHRCTLSIVFTIFIEARFVSLSFQQGEGPNRGQRPNAALFSIDVKIVQHFRWGWSGKMLWTVIFYWCNLKSWTCHHLFSSVVGWPHRPRLMPHSNNTTENEYSHAVTLST